MLPAALEWKGFAYYPDWTCACPPEVGLLLQAAIICLPPPVRGRFWKFDGGMFLLGGVGEDPTPVYPVRWVGSWKTALSSLSSTARARRQIVKAIRPIKMLEKGSGKSLTSIGRPLPRSATACIVGSEASGFVPASDINGGSSGLWLDGGDRGGPDCFSLSFREVLSTLARVLCVLLVFYEVPCNNLYLRCLVLI
jgi:hypothetical protein